MTGRFFRTVFALIAVALLPACQNEEQGVAAVPEASSPKVVSSTVPGVSYVKFDDATVALIEDAVASGGVATKSAETNELFSSIGVYSMERLFPDAGEFEEEAFTVWNASSPMRESSKRGPAGKAFIAGI